MRDMSRPDVMQMIMQVASDMPDGDVAPERGEFCDVQVVGFDLDRSQACLECSYARFKKARRSLCDYE